MAHRKAGGSAKNLSDSNPKYLGIKINNGQQVKKGGVIVKQRGTKFITGKNTSLSKDHSIFALIDGIVSYQNKRKISFDNRIVTRKEVSVI